MIKSLIKRFTRQALSDTNGPITVVSGKKRRLTFMECPNDLSSMVDCAKVADLVLLMIDASFGFEMVCCLNSLSLSLSPHTLKIKLWLPFFTRKPSSSSMSARSTVFPRSWGF